jgi:hypothetical protein
MSSMYRPNTNHTNNGPLNVMPDNLQLNQTNKVNTSCEECTSIYDTMNYRSNFDKTYVPAYQSRLSMFDTNPLNLVFQK